MPDVDRLLMGELYQTIGQQAVEIRSLTKLVGLLREDLKTAQAAIEAAKHGIKPRRAT